MKKVFLTLTSLLLFMVAVPLVLAAVWISEDIHEHTGYSTWWGYDGNPLTTGDNCWPWTLEGHIAGDTVEELAADALDSDLNYLAFSDHSYCIDSSEFNQVQNDCEVVDDDEQNYPNFTCLMGEELSTQDILGEPNFILSGNSKSSREFYKFYIILGRNVIVNRK